MKTYFSSILQNNIYLIKRSSILIPIALSTYAGPTEHTKAHIGTTGIFEKGLCVREMGKTRRIYAPRGKECRKVRNNGRFENPQTESKGRCRFRAEFKRECRLLFWGLEKAGDSTLCFIAFMDGDSNFLKMVLLGFIAIVALYYSDSISRMKWSFVEHLYVEH